MAVECTYRSCRTANRLVLDGNSETTFKNKQKCKEKM